MTPPLSISLGLSLALAMVACGLGEGDPPEKEPTMNLPEVGQRVPLPPEAVHGDELELEAGTFLRLEVEQRGVDLRLGLFDSQGKEIAWADSPTGTTGPEELVVVTPNAGVYRLQVRAPAGPKPKKPGEYEVKTRERRTADSRDRRWADVEGAFWAARKLVKAERFGEAIPELRQLIPVWQELGHRAREAHTREELAVALRQRDPEEALEQWQKAIVVYRLLGPPVRLGNALESAGLLLHHRGDLETAAIYLEEAVPLLREGAHLWGLALALSQLGVIARAQGEPELGLDRHRRALALAQQSGRESTEAVVRTDLGFTLLTLHHPQEAEEHFTRAVDIYRRKQEARELRLALDGLARTAVQLNDLEAARVKVREALAVEVQDPRSEAVLRQTLGHVLRLEGRWQEAKAEFERIDRIERVASIPLVRADLLLSQGYLEGEMGRPEAGLPMLDEALEIYTTHGSQAGEASARARGAELLRALGRRQAAWGRLAPALRAVEHQRGAAAQRDHRLAYFAFRQDYFELGRDLLLELYDQASDEEEAEEWRRQAFSTDERRRSQELLSGGLGRKGELEDLARQQELGVELRTTLRSSTTSQDQRKLSGLLSRIHQLQGRSAEAEGSLPSLKEIQGLLDPEIGLVIYSLGQEQSILWWLSRSSLEFHRLPPRSELERKARRFTQAVAFPSKENLETVDALGPQLTQALLGPVMENMKGRRLGIVADGELQILPFAALPDPEGQGFLVERHEIGRLPSASALVALRRRLEALPASRSMSIFADPVFTGDDPRAVAQGNAAGTGTDSEDGDLSPPPLLARSVDALGLEGLQRLRGARREAEYLRDLAEQTLGVAPDLVWGFDADRERFLAAAGEPLAVLHVATHALLHPQPELSGLVLSRVGSGGREKDGFLTALEVSQQTFPVDLVSLSACQTGVGKAIPGEGTLSLAWAFLDAGAGRVLASLWKVSDEETARLMEDFYRALLVEGQAPTAALRTAQRAMIRRPGSTPYDWAGFLVQGDGFRDLKFGNP